MKSKKMRITALLLVMVMVFSLSVQAGTFEAKDYLYDYESGQVLLRGDLADISARLTGSSELSEAPDGESADDPNAPVTQQEVAAFLLRFAGMKDSQLGNYPDDYNALAESVGLTAGLDYDPTAPATADDFSIMLENVNPLYEALHAEEMEPFFVDGMAQPIFDYDEVIRFCVYVETNYDTDGDGKLDLVKTLVQLPGAVLDGMEVAAIYEARPYITGCNSSMNPGTNYRYDGYDISSMYAQPAARVPAGEATTAEAAAAANPDDWYYYNPYEDMMVYEDLNWYDYYLVRGYAVVECGGLGTKGSDGFETCGADFEIDAFKCVIEWMTGDRVAYTDKEGNVAIEADWSNGKVGMTGRSYAGTTQFGLATTGVKGLETIVPVAGIASWYEYTNSQGISTSTNVAYSDRLAWYCTGRYQDADDYATIADKYGNYLYQLKLDQEASNGDYSAHWANRDYTLDWENINCPALIVHGLNDDNVRTKQSDLMYQAYAKSGQNVKLLLHQGAHMTPTYPAYEYEIYIDDVLYDEILNKWFSHYLYGVENGIENMPNVTSQSNIDGSWDYYNSWETDKAITLDCDDTAEEATTTISSNHSEIGVTNSTWRNIFTSGSTASSSMYTIEITEDTTIKGTVAVNIRATTNAAGNTVVTPGGTDNVTPYTFDEDIIMTPGGIDREAVADPNAASNARITPFSMSTFSTGRDAIMMSAMLVDIDESGFMTYNTSGSQVPINTLKEGGAWMGGGLKNFDLAEYRQSEVTYKIIARGWMDMYNPTAGYDSASAAERIELEEGQYYDYTLYLQPNLYTVEEGHTLALVIYTYEPSKANYSAANNYTITIDNAETFASIPVNNPVATVSFDAKGGSEVASQTVTIGEATTKPADPTRTGYTFGGWYSDETLTTAYDFSAAVTADITLYAKWTINEYTVTFNSNNGSSVASQKVAHGGTVTKPADPARTGYTFGGWYSDSKLSQAYNFSTQVTGNLTLYAKWTEEAKEDNHTPYINGFDDGTFRPEANLTRAQTAMILYRLVDDENKDTADVTSKFSDMTKGTWYYHAVAYLENEGLIKGYSDNTFEPEKTITRAEFVTLVARFAKLDISAPGNTTFKDITNKHWAYNAITKAADKGWIQGDGDGTFRPEDSIKRAEAVTVINRMLGRTPVAENIPAECAGIFSDVTDSTKWYYAAVIEAATNHNYTLDEDGNEIWSSWSK